MSKRNSKGSHTGSTQPASLPADVSLDSSATVEMNPQHVAERAYRRWVERGCPLGSPDQDWFDAERELRALLGAP